VRLEERLALGVVLARDRVVVPGGAVGLDDEAVVRPAEVGDHAAAADRQRDVHVRAREPAALDESEHDVLEVASRRRGIGSEEAGDPRRAGAGRKAVRRLDELRHGDEAVSERLAEGAADRMLVEDAGDVDQGSGDGGHRQRAEARDVSSAECLTAVDAYLAVAPRRRAGDRHLWEPVIPDHDLVRRRRREVAEARVGPARQDGGEEPAVQRQSGVPDGIHAAV
jgi:hypothetical protein